jgi:hypothetical protein
MNLQPINSLPESTNPSATDILVAVVSGAYRRLQMANLVKALPLATTSVKGLMGSSDKDALNSLIGNMTDLVAPANQAIASASTITIPSGKYLITLSGTTTINTVVGLVPRVRYMFYYPTGAGLNFLGEEMKAGDFVEVVDV